VEILNGLVAIALVGGGWILTNRLLSAGLERVRDPLTCRCGFPHSRRALRANRPARIPPPVHGAANLLNAAGFRPRVR
jgi:hypothetical protein